MTAAEDIPGFTLSALSERILDRARRSPVGPGGRLPTERRLADELGVSRTGVRHALAQLEAAGVLSREVGRGTFLRPDVGAPRPGAPLLPLTDVAPADVMAVRSLIEPQAMGLVILHATERDLEEMDRSLRGGDTAESHADFEAWDRALHRSLIDATHNRLLQSLYRSVDASRENQVWGQLKRRNDSAERRSRYQCEHHAIVDAVRARDREGATRAAQEHLTTVSMNIFGRVV